MTAPPARASDRPHLRRDWAYLLINLLPLVALVTGATTFDWILCAVLYVARMFCVAGVYHRYFSHRSYRTSRGFQFGLACLAQTSLQKGALWWAAGHRQHHRYSDLPGDPHSPVQLGFWQAHIGWIFAPEKKATRYDRVRDFAGFPELVWLDRRHALPGFVLIGGAWLIGCWVNGGGPTAGLSTVAVGFGLSTVLLWQGTYAVNSFGHLVGRQRFVTGEGSRNNWILVFTALGDGWHNNHHRYPTSARHGFDWWEFDPTYYLLLALARTGLIWDLRPVPDRVRHPDRGSVRLATGKRVGRPAGIPTGKGV